MLKAYPKLEHKGLAPGQSGVGTDENEVVALATSTLRDFFEHRDVLTGDARGADGGRAASAQTSSAD